MNRPYFQSEGIKIQTAQWGGALSRPPRSIFRAHQIVKKKKKKNVYSRGYHAKVNKQH